MKPFFHLVRLGAEAWNNRASHRRRSVLPLLRDWACAVTGTQTEAALVHQGIWKLTLRVRMDGAGAVAQWLPSRKEFRACLALGNHLRDNGVPVPRILAADEAHRFLLLDDLGGKTLSLIDESDLPEDTPIQAAAALADFHRRGCNGFRPEFSWRKNGRLTLARWMLDCAARLYPWMAANATQLPRRWFFGIHREMKAYADALHWRENAQGLLHTDWHYENLMPAPGGLYVIDWQGAALGPLSLDLARLSMTNTKAVWKARDALVSMYMTNYPPVAPENFLRQLELMETGWMMRLFPLFAGEEKAGNKKVPLVAAKLRAIAERESMKTFPLLADLFRQAATLMERNVLTKE